MVDAACVWARMRGRMDLRVESCYRCCSVAAAVAWAAGREPARQRRARAPRDATDTHNDSGGINVSRRAHYLVLGWNMVGMRRPAVVGGNRREEAVWELLGHVARRGGSQCSGVRVGVQVLRLDGRVMGRRNGVQVGACRYAKAEWGRAAFARARQNGGRVSGCTSWATSYASSEFERELAHHHAHCGQSTRNPSPPNRPRCSRHRTPLHQPPSRPHCFISRKHPATNTHAAPAALPQHGSQVPPACRGQGPRFHTRL